MAPLTPSPLERPLPPRAMNSDGVCVQRSGGERSCGSVVEERRLRGRRTRLRRAPCRARPGRHQSDVVTSRSRPTLPHLTRRHAVHPPRFPIRSVCPRPRPSVCSMPLAQQKPHRYTGTHVRYEITRHYLPHGRGDFPAFTLASLSWYSIQQPRGYARLS